MSRALQPLARCATSRARARRSPGRSAAACAAPRCPPGPAPCRRRRRRRARAHGRRDPVPASRSVTVAAASASIGARQVVELDRLDLRVAGGAAPLGEPRRPGSAPPRPAGAITTSSAPGGYWPASEPAAAPSTGTASVPTEAEHPEVAPRASGSRTAAALPSTSMHWPTSARGHRRRRPAQVGDQVGEPGRAAAVEQPRLAPVRRGTSSCRPRCTSSTEPLPVASGMPHDLVAVLDARLVVDHGVPAREAEGGVVELGEHPARPRQRDPQHELLEDRRPAPERLDAGHVLAGQHQVDALRATAPGDVLEQHGGRPRDRVALGEQVLELVDHGDDPRPRARPGPRRAAPPAWSPRAPWPPPRGGASRRRGTAAAPARTRGRC